MDGGIYSDPSPHAVPVGAELRTEARLQGPLLGEYLEAVQVENEQGREGQRREAVEVEGPGEEDEEEAEVHRIAGPAVDPSGHQGGGAVGMHGIDRGPRLPEAKDPGEGRAEAEEHENESYGLLSGEVETAEGEMAGRYPHGPAQDEGEEGGRDLELKGLHAGGK